MRTHADEGATEALQKVRIDGPAPSFALAPDPATRASPPASDPRQFDPAAIGLALSGGGFKAAAYHLGGLARLNERGLLPRISRIASVSGGSLTAAWLGLRWKDLSWSADGVAENFAEVITAPLERFLTSANLDFPAGLAGLLTPCRTGADNLARAYAKRLFGQATLQDLPDEAQAPRFVILATNYALNSLWRFARVYAADYRVGMIRNPTFALARIVAASSGFPPFFCPVSLDFEGQVLLPLEGADQHRAPYAHRAELADGGIYDNLGVEPIWKRCGVVLVSNAGDPFDEAPHPAGDWVSCLRRVTGMIHRQAENNRVRQFVAMAQAGQRRLVYWPLRNTIDDYGDPGSLVLDPAEIALAQKQAVRLWSLSPPAFRALVRHGYSLCDAATRSYPAPGQLSSTPTFPV